MMHLIRDRCPRSEDISVGVSGKVLQKNNEECKEGWGKVEYVGGEHSIQINLL